MAEIARHTTEYAEAMAQLNFMEPELIRNIKVETSGPIGHTDGNSVKVQFNALSDLDQAASAVESRRTRIVSERHPMLLERYTLEASIGALLRIGEDVDAGRLESKRALRGVGKVVKVIGLMSLNHLVKTPDHLRTQEEIARQATKTLIPLIDKKEKKRFQPFANGEV